VQAIIFLKKIKKYFNNVLEYFSIIFKEKLQKNQPYFENILVQIIVRKYFIMVEKYIIYIPIII
jgi:hypothetical protein